MESRNFELLYDSKESQEEDEYCGTEAHQVRQYCDWVFQQCQEKKERVENRCSYASREESRCKVFAAIEVNFKSRTLCEKHPTDKACYSSQAIENQALCHW